MPTQQLEGAKVDVAQTKKAKSDEIKHMKELLNSPDIKNVSDHMPKICC
jgi:hypothetical protein